MICHQAILPIKTSNPTNGSHGHWSKQARIRKAQRAETRLHLRNLIAVQFPVVIELTRIAPRELDDDNLRPALKSIRDGVTDALGLTDDRDKRLTWEYGQRKGKPRQYAVDVKIKEQA